MTKSDELFEFVSILKEKYKDKEEFNLLHSVGFRSQEIMHSKFIATMLDPKGLHGMSDRNLKLFLERIGITGFQTENAEVKTERPAGNRWIDIKISVGNDVLIIENKVWAKDQDRQLADYYRACKTADNRVEVIYLTLDGKCPTENSLGEVLTLNQVKCISYKKHIIPWIDECAESGTDRIKVSLEMYNELLRDLINKNKHMDELFETLKNDKEKLKLAIDINSALQGRNYIKEFPETIDFLKSRIREIIEDSEPHMDENDTILNINIEGHDLENWRLYLEDGDEFYASDDRGSHILLFNKSNISDKKLKSLIFQEVDFVDEWLTSLFTEMRNKPNSSC